MSHCLGIAIGGPSKISKETYRAGRHLAARKECLGLPFRIAQSWLDSVVYFYPDIARAESGEEAGGTGFLLGGPIPDSTDVTLWVVTNRHTIESGHWAIRLNGRTSGLEFVDTDETEWLVSENSDLAVRPIKLSPDIQKFTFLSRDWLLSREWYEALDIGPGDECVTIGRFLGHDGKRTNNPTARFGQIAQAPIEPVMVGGKEQECFLVESRSLGGYSGSPVFVHLDSAYYRPTINLRTGPDGVVLGQGLYPTGPWLLGLCFSMVPLWENVCDSQRRELQNGYCVQMNTGMMGVVPAWHLIESLEIGAASVMRKYIETGIQAELKAMREASAVTPTEKDG